MTWNPEQPNQYVRVIDNPGLCGLTTGKVRRAGSILYVYVRFGPNEVQSFPSDLLEPCPTQEDRFDLLRAGRFGGPDDLRRLLTFEKKGGSSAN